MKVVIDKRENGLYDRVCNCLQFLKILDIEITSEVLHLGDIIIKTDLDETILIIERKTITDLLSSIKDGRYAEQSLRLANNGECSNNQIVYLIEGVFVSSQKNEKQLVNASLTTLNFFKGFSVMKTLSIDDTAEWILICADKINRSLKNGKKLYSEHSIPTTNYCDVIKTVKKENVTKENIGEIMLMQIPGISSVLAKAILNKFASFSEFIHRVNTEPNCLDGMTYECKGKERKINKSCLESINNYLNSSATTTNE